MALAAAAPHTGEKTAKACERPAVSGRFFSLTLKKSYLSAILGFA
jgi:hypothetical protein